MTLEEAKKEFPINSIGLVGDRLIKITGYHFDTYNWWPINVVEGFTEENKTIKKPQLLCNDPIDFAEKYLNIKLYPWQKTILNYFFERR